MTKLTFPLSRQQTVLTIAAVLLLVAAVLLIQKPTSIPGLPNPPLKDLAAKHNIELGNFAILNRINEPAYDAILKSQFEFVLADNTPNWYFTDGGLRPGPDSYNFVQMDQVMDYAKKNGQAVQAHHLLWGEEKWLPDWLKNSGYSKEELSTIIQQHIQAVAGRYKGQIREWTVVNEAFTRSQNEHGLRDWWVDNTGGLEFIDDAFIWARQADPSAKLILNDFGNEVQNPISDLMLEYIQSAKARGVPIDGIGMQMHIDGTQMPSKEAVMANMQRFKAIGVDVYVTEFDVNMSNFVGTNGQKDMAQAEIYYTMMRACIESKACRSFAQLGITDNETWYNYMGPASANARPLMFDRDYRPKPAFYRFREALEQP